MFLRSSHALRLAVVPLALALTAWLSALGPANAEEDTFKVAVDEAKLLRLERPAAEIIVGNPSIADVAVQSGKLLVITGKSFGRTNLIVIDAQGRQIVNTRLSVDWAGRDMVAIWKGTSRLSYYCAPRCQVPLVIGDHPDYFAEALKEIEGKQKLGESSAEGSSQIQ